MRLLSVIFLSVLFFSCDEQPEMIGNNETQTTTEKDNNIKIIKIDEAQVPGLKELSGIQAIEKCIEHAFLLSEVKMDTVKLFQEIKRSSRNGLLYFSKAKAVNYYEYKNISVLEFKNATDCKKSYKTVEKKLINNTSGYDTDQLIQNNLIYIFNEDGSTYIRSGKYIVHQIMNGKMDHNQKQLANRFAGLIMGLHSDQSNLMRVDYQWDLKNAIIQ
jgi:hypothetical protein